MERMLGEERRRKGEGGRECGRRECGREEGRERERNAQEEFVVWLTLDRDVVDMVNGTVNGWSVYGSVRPMSCERCSGLLDAV